MTTESAPVLSITGLFEEREAKRRQDQAANTDMQRKAQEEIEQYRKRLDEFRMEEVNRQNQIRKIKLAFERGDTEVMLISFPSSFCTDGGRAVNNADLPPLNPPKRGEAPPTPADPVWLDTLPGGVRSAYEWWKQALKPGGIKFSVRIISYPEGKLGDVGLFYSWSRDQGVSG